jgi:hypothetical protein
MFSLGNAIGHPGLQDGTTTWDTIRLPSAVPLGCRILIEYQPGLWTGRTLSGRTDRGDGTADYKVVEVLPTNVQDNASILGTGMHSDFIHPALHGVLRTVSRIQQSEKAKFYPAA